MGTYIREGDWIGGGNLKVVVILMLAYNHITNTEFIILHKLLTSAGAFQQENKLQIYSQVI